MIEQRWKPVDLEGKTDYFYPSLQPGSVQVACNDGVLKWCVSQTRTYTRTHFIDRIIFRRNGYWSDWSNVPVGDKDE